jgi:hypothetical protein
LPIHSPRSHPTLVSTQKEEEFAGDFAIHGVENLFVSVASTGVLKGRKTVEKVI